MARCNDCNKFVSYGDIEAEIVGEQVDEDVLTAEVTITLTCAECGSGLKEVTTDFEHSIDHTCEGAEVEGDVFEIVSSDASGTDRLEDKDKKGKPIKNHRYMRTFYGADLTFEVQCNRCKETFEIVGNVEEQASGFMEL